MHKQNTQQNQRPMSDAKQSNESDQAKLGLLAVNKLNYSLPSDLCVCVSRTHTSQFFQQREHSPGSTAVCVLNTGAAYIDGRRSFLVVDVMNSSTGNASFGALEPNGSQVSSGSAANMFQRLTIMSRSGSVLERIDDLAKLCHIKQEYLYDNQYSESVMQAAGWNQESLWVTGSVKRFVIPMSLMSGLFEYDRLLPASLMSGLRIEIQLANSSDALVGVTDGDTLAYEIKNMRLEVESYLLTDLVLRSLNTMASSSGLEVVINTVSTTLGSRNTSSVNMECRKAVSRSLCVVYCERPSKTAGKSKTDALASAALTPTEGPLDVSWQLGSQYFPNTSIRGSTPLIVAPEAYVHMLQTFRRYHADNYRSKCTLKNYIFRGSCCLGTSLERSEVLSLAGQPLSNSRVLALNATFANTPTGNLNVSMFLWYVSLIRVFNSNQVVEI